MPSNSLYCRLQTKKPLPIAPRNLQVIIPGELKRLHSTSRIGLDRAKANNLGLADKAHFPYKMAENPYFLDLIR